MSVDLILLITSAIKLLNSAVFSCSVNWFMSSGALQWHISEAATKPLANDHKAIEWLNHNAHAVRENAVLAFEIDELDEVARLHGRLCDAATDLTHPPLRLVG